MATELAVAQQEKIANEIERISAECLQLTTTCKNKMLLAFKRADAIIALRELLNADVMGRFVMPLAGSGLGFGMDKEYPMPIIRDCAIEAILRGVGLAGDHWMIIGSRTFIKQQGCAYMVLSTAGVTDVELMPEIPKMKDGGCVVGMKAKWNFNGKPMELNRTGEHAFAVRLNAGQGADQAVGKATRKMYAAIYQRLTGNLEYIPDVDEDELKPATGTVVESTPTTNGKDHTPAAPTTPQSQSDRAAAILRAQQEAPAPAATEPPPQTNVQEGKPEGAKKTRKKQGETAAPAAAAPQVTTQPATPATAAPAAAAAAPAQAATAAATPAAAQPAKSFKDSIPAPKPEDLQEARFVPVKVTSYQLPSTKEVVYRIRDEKATMYTTTDINYAKEARLAQETKQNVVLSYHPHGQDYIVVELKVEKAPAQQEPEAEEEELK